MSVTHHQPPFKRRLCALLCLAALSALPPALHAAESAAAAVQAGTRSIDIGPGPLSEVLARYAASAGVALSFDAASLRQIQSPGLKGNYTVQQGFDRLLAGSGLTAVKRESGYQLQPAPQASGETTLGTVTVTAVGVDENAWGPVKGYLARHSASGTKTGAPILETPQSISVVTADRIEALGATTVKEVLAYTPGVEIAPYGTDSRYDWINIRGFDAYSPGFYLDGLQLRNNAWWAVWQTENYGIERIEIMRGPSSVLFGQNAPGGLVNLVSKRPAAGTPNEIQVQFGSDARRQLAGDFSGALDADGNALYRVLALVRDGEQPEGKMADDRVFLAPSLTLKPSSATTLTLQAQLLRSRAGTYVRSLPESGTLVRTPAGTRLPRDVYAGEPDFNRLDQDQLSFGYSLEHHAGDTWTLRQQARYAELDMDYRQVYQSGFVTVNGDASDPINYRFLSRNVNGSKEKIRLLSIDNQAQADFAVGTSYHTVLLGLDYQQGRFDQRSYFSGTVGDLDLDNPVYGQSVVAGPIDVDARTKLTQLGLYLQDQMRTGNWITNLAARYDRATVDNDDRLLGTRVNQTDGKLSGRAGIVYQHPSGWAPYASYTTSFSPVTTIDPLTNKPFDPETGRQIEAGIRYQPSGHKALYGAALFDLRRQNFISYTPLTFIPKQTGEINVRGLELEAVVTPLPALNLTAAYAFTPRAEVTQSENPAEVGKQANAVARHRLSLWGDYRFAAGIKIGLGARYTGPTRGINESASADVPGYTIFDALLGYDVGRWNLALNVHNLGDKTYITNCGSGSCYFGTQRRTLLTASYRW
jgi:iron complex outermembrane receptor protein